MIFIGLRKALGVGRARDFWSVGRGFDPDVLQMYLVLLLLNGILGVGGGKISQLVVIFIGLRKALGVNPNTGNLAVGLNFTQTTQALD